MICGPLFIYLPNPAYLGMCLAREISVGGHISFKQGREILFVKVNVQRTEGMKERAIWVTKLTSEEIKFKVEGKANQTTQRQTIHVFM